MPRHKLVDVDVRDFPKFNSTTVGTLDVVIVVREDELVVNESLTFHAVATDVGRSGIYDSVGHGITPEVEVSVGTGLSPIPRTLITLAVVRTTTKV